MICTCVTLFLLKCQVDAHRGKIAQAPNGGFVNPAHEHDDHVRGTYLGGTSTSSAHRVLPEVTLLHDSQAREAASCDSAAFSDLYQTITADLSHWKESGITQLLMDQSLAALGSIMAYKGIAIMFEAGVAYIIRRATWHCLEPSTLGYTSMEIANHENLPSGSKDALASDLHCSLMSLSQTV